MAALAASAAACRDPSSAGPTPGQVDPESSALTRTGMTGESDPRATRVAPSEDSKTSAQTPASPAANAATPEPPAAMPSSGTASAASGNSLAAVDARLDRMLSAAANCTSDAECRTVAVGGKACGGPTGYRAYSSKGADPQAVEDLARQERELALAAARASGRVSNCLMVGDPGAHCVQNKCTSGPAGGPGAPMR